MKQYIFLVFLILGILLASGCIELEEGTPAGAKEPRISPSKVAETYFKELISSSSDYQKMWNLLSDEEKSTWLASLGDFDDWADGMEGVKNDYTRDRITFRFMEVKEEQIGAWRGQNASGYFLIPKEDASTVLVKCKSIWEGDPHTETIIVNLVKQENSWKLNLMYDLNHCFG